MPSRDASIAPGHFCGRPCRDGVSLFNPSLFFRTVSHSAVRTSHSPNPTEPKGFACEKACVWPAVPLAILAVPPILTLSPRRFLCAATSMTARPNHRSAASGATPGPHVRSYRASSILIRPGRLALCFALLAALSTAAGFQVARFHNVWARWLSAHPVQATSSIQPLPSLVSDSKPAATSVELEKLSHLAPQLQAERLLDLAIHRDERSLEIIHQRQDAWRGRLESTDRLFHLVLAALDSEDPRVRAAAVEIDLAASNLSKSPESVAHLLNQINNDPGSRSLRSGDSAHLAIVASNRPSCWRLCSATRTTQASRRASGRSKDWRCSARTNPSIRFSPSWPTTLRQKSVSAPRAISRAPACSPANSGSRLCRNCLISSMMMPSTPRRRTWSTRYCIRSPAHPLAGTPKPGAGGGPTTTALKSRATSPEAFLSLDAGIALQVFHLLHKQGKNS